MRWWLKLVLLAALLSPQALGCATPELTGWAAHYARAFGIDEELFIAVVWVESRFCQHAISRAGAIGMGQLMPGTAAGLGVDPHDMHQNLWGAAKYLRSRWELFGDWRLALAAYNAGAGNVRRFGGIPPFEETQNYVKTVLSVYNALRERRLQAAR